MTKPSAQSIRPHAEKLLRLLRVNQRGIPEIPREVLFPGRWADGSALPPKR